MHVFLVDGDEVVEEFFSPQFNPDSLSGSCTDFPAEVGGELG